VNYLTPIDDYEMSMTTATDSYGGSTCGPFDFYDLRKALKGSGKSWRSTCKSGVEHTLTIKPKTDCEWEVQYLYFKVKGVKKVQVYVDDKKVYSVSAALSSHIKFSSVTCNCKF